MKYKPTALKTMQKSNKDFKRNLSTMPNSTKSEYKQTDNDRRRELEKEIWNAPFKLFFEPLKMRGVTNG